MTRRTRTRDASWEHSYRREISRLDLARRSGSLGRSPASAWSTLATASSEASHRSSSGPERPPLHRDGGSRHGSGRVRTQGPRRSAGNPAPAFETRRCMTRRAKAGWGSSVPSQGCLRPAASTTWASWRRTRRISTTTATRRRSVTSIHGRVSMIPARLTGYGEDLERRRLHALGGGGRAAGGLVRREPASYQTDRSGVGGDSLRIRDRVVNAGLRPHAAHALLSPEFRLSVAERGCSLPCPAGRRGVRLSRRRDSTASRASAIEPCPARRTASANRSGNTTCGPIAKAGCGPPSSTTNSHSGR